MSKILIVDDDKNICATIVGVLRKEGHKVDVMPDGNKAIEAIAEKTYDIALIDIRMPGINGVETYRKLKEISPETIVMMMTAYALDDLKKDALREGVYGIIDKPFDMNQVIGMMSDISSKNYVLIVDDDVDYRKKIKESLSSQGFIAVSVENGDKALSVLERKVPDVIVLDYKLPDETGLQTMERIEELAGNMESPPEVIMVTGYRNEEIEKKAHELGIKKVMQKPFSIDELKKEIEKIVSKRNEDSTPQKHTVLVVDDETSFRNMLSDTLRVEGYDVKEAENGNKALEIISGDGCKAVLLDIKLPDISGLEVYRKIKKDHPGMNIIMMTAYAKDKALMEKIQEGGYTCLIKPFKTSKLLGMIRNITACE